MRGEGRSHGTSLLLPARAARVGPPGPDRRRAAFIAEHRGRFVAPAPNRTWVADFTHVVAWADTVHVAFVVDTFSRRIVGWSASMSKGPRVQGDPTRPGCTGDGLGAARPRRSSTRAGRAGSPLRRGQPAGTPRSAWPSSSTRPGSRPRSAQSATRWTTPSWSRPSACPRPRSSNRGGPGRRHARPPARRRLRTPGRGGEHQGALGVARPLGPGLHAADVHAASVVQRDPHP